MNQTFADLRPQIVLALEQKFTLPNAFPGEITGFTLVDGFTMQSIQARTGGIVIGGNSIPMVIVVGNTTGKAYYFPLKALLPNITI